MAANGTARGGDACAAGARTGERGVARVQMSEVGNLIGHERTAATRMLGPAVYARLEEGAVNDELTTTLEQIEEADLPFRSIELILFFNSQPGHPPTLGC